MIRSLGEQWKIRLSAQDIYCALGDTHNSLVLSAQTDYAVSTNASLSAGVNWKRAYNVHETEGTLSLNLYF